MLTLQRPLSLFSAALFIGLCIDRLLYGRAPGIALTLVVTLLLAVLARLAHDEGRPANPANTWIGAAALVFALLLAVRASPLLSSLNLLAVGGLLLLHVTLYRAEGLARLEPWRVGVGTLVGSFESMLLPAPFAGGLIGEAGSLRPHVRGGLVVMRGSLLAAPVLLLFTGLLGMADRVFASYVNDLLRLRLPFDLPGLLHHLILTCTISWVVAGGLLLALREHPQGSLLGSLPGSLPAEGETQRLELRRSLRPLGLGEALTVLVLVDGLFGVFMLVQAAYLFGGHDTLARTGLGFAEYARRGFFELVAVAVLALGLLWLFALFTRRGHNRQRRAFNTASTLMVALVLGMLVSAALRMWLYEQAYGFTMLRLLTHSWMAWLSMVLLLFLAALWRDWLRWFSLGLPCAAACYLLALNLLNPEALIVRENLVRYQATGDLDSSYLTTLSPDAAPALAAALPQLGPAGVPLREHLRVQAAYLASRSAREGWPAWNLGRARAIAVGHTVGARTSPTLILSNRVDRAGVP